MLQKKTSQNGYKKIKKGTQRERRKTGSTILYEPISLPQNSRSTEFLFFIRFGLMTKIEVTISLKLLLEIYFFTRSNILTRDAVGPAGGQAAPRD